jgi:hypothetical protein
MQQQVSQHVHLALSDSFPRLQVNLRAQECTPATQVRKRSQVHHHQRMDAQIAYLVHFKLQQATFFLHAILVA